MATLAAAGNRVLVGYRLESPADVPIAGHPEPVRTVTAAGAACTATAGGDPGDMLPGDYAYTYTYVEKDGFETVGATLSTPATVTDSDVINLTDIANSASSTVIAKRIYRKHTLTGADPVGPYLLGTIYDNTTTTWTDSLLASSALIDLTKVPPTYNQTGANSGFKFQYVEAADIKVDYTVLPSNELTSTIGEAEAYPGQAKFTHTMKQMVRAGYLVPLLSSFIGRPTKHGVTSGVEDSSAPWDEPTRIYAFDPVTSDSDALTLSVLHYKGFDKPEFFWQNMPDELAITFEENKPLEISTKLMGCAHQKVGIGTVVTVGGSYKGTVVCRGIRMDDAAMTDTLKVKVISAPSGGTFTIKARRSGASYGGSGTLMTVHYNTTSKRQTDYAGQVGDWVELIDETGAFIGGDVDELRRPFSIMFTGDVTSLQADDEFLIPLKALIPGVGSTPGTADSNYTGFPPLFVNEPRFGPAHVLFQYGNSAANTRLNFQKGSIKLSRAIDPVNSLGPEAAFASDLDRPGKIKCQLSLTRRLTGREWENRIETNQRVYLALTLQGPRIVVNPGSYSVFRHSLAFTAPHARVSDVKSAVTNDKVINETITLDVEQPRDVSISPFAITATTPEDWYLPVLNA